MTPILVTKGLSRQFGGLRAVEKVDFEIVPGEIRALIGPNGAGKTTFVSLVCGRIEASAGMIVFDGQDVTRLPAHQRVRRGIAYTFQITSIYGNLTAEENVALAAQRGSAGARPAAGKVRERVESALERTGLIERRGTIASTLAYGHQRLLEVAMGLALRPRLLILDEPTQGLSDGEIENFIGLVKDISRDATVLLIEHNMNVVMQLADRITVLNFGKVLAEGTPEAIRANADVQRAYLGTLADG